jgi:hypothetical protein
MFKYLLLIFSVFSSTAALAQIPPTVLQSETIKKARACMVQLAAEARNAGFDTESPNPASVTIMDRSQDKLLPLASNIIECLDTALPTKEVRSRGDNSQSTQLWYSKVEDYYVCCVTPAEGEDDKFVTQLGGHSERRNWYVILYRCGVGKEIDFDFST